MTNDVSPQILLAFLNRAWESAAATANTLRPQLVQEQVAATNFIALGSLASVGKNSSNQSYKNYGPATLTQVQIVEVYGNLLGLYDELKSRITCAFEKNTAEFPDGVPDTFDFDPAVYDLLTKTFNAMNSGVATQLTDISSLRLLGGLTPEGVVSWN